MKDDLIILSGDAVAWTFTVAEFKELAAGISYIFAILSSVLTICYIIWKWYKKATSDDSKGGKDITLDEIKELKEDIKDHVKSGKEDL